MSAGLHYTKCPSCLDESSLRVSKPRSSRERMIKSVTWFDIYRCKKCGWRGTKSSFRFTAAHFKRMILYLLMMIAAGLLVYQVLKRIS